MSPRPPDRRDTELGVFLRSRRDRLQPADVGLPAGGGLRRTPGLRREQLATLAGISIDYYVRLERGTERHPSPAVVSALAEALRLDREERAHLRLLVKALDDPRPAPDPSREAPEGMRIMLERLRPLPAFVANSYGDLLAANPALIGLLVGIGDTPEEDRNTVRYVFLHPAARTLYADWEQEVAGLVTGLRRLTGIDPDNPRLLALIDELRDRSAEFEPLWERYDVETYRRGTQRLDHPELGMLEASYQVLRVDGSDQALFTYLAEPGTALYEGFVRLDGGDDSEQG